MSYGRNPVIKGEERTALATELAEQYARGDSIRTIADRTGRSYGGVYRLLVEAGVALRGRGGDRRSSAVRGRRGVR